MGFRREVDDAPGLLVPDHPVNQVGVDDIPVHEAIVAALADIGEVGEVARVGELVQVHDTPIGAGGSQQTHEVAADEPASSRHHD